MEYTEASIGRIFILRLENGDQIPETIEKFAETKEISSATVLFIGGADKEGEVAVGPKDGSAEQPIPDTQKLSGVSEAIGAGTIFTNEDELPKLHLHSAFGRKDKTITGCTKAGGIDIWNIGEVIILELKNHSARRKIDPETGFELLEL